MRIPAADDTWKPSPMARPSRKLWAVKLAGAKWLRLAFPIPGWSDEGAVGEHVGKEPRHHDRQDDPSIEARVSKVERARNQIEQGDA